MGYGKFPGIPVDIFTGFSRERFLRISADSQERFPGISADFPQNCYLGSIDEILPGHRAEIIIIMSSTDRT